MEGREPGRAAEAEEAEEGKVVVAEGGVGSLSEASAASAAAHNILPQIPGELAANSRASLLGGYTKDHRSRN